MRGGSETPPRAWGRLLSAENIEVIFRNTPTGVGKTEGGFFSPQMPQKHPHGRGEDA